MKQTFIIRNNGKHLLLFFAGWGMDETPFRHIHPAECDWMICYDYRSLEFDTTLIQAYSEIPLMAVLWETGREGYCFITCEAAQTPIDHAISEILEYACIKVVSNSSER